MLLPASWRRRDQHRGAAVFGQAIEHPVGGGDGAFAQRLFLGPDLFAGLEVLANPADTVGIAQEVTVHEHNAAMVVLHHFAEVNVAHVVAGGTDLDQFGSDAVAGADIDLAVLKDRRGNHRRLAGPVRGPKHLAIPRGDAADLLHGPPTVLAAALVAPAPG